ncbi:MAG: hypothetical protein AABX29_02080 [Nanoarchaeota archaeon]
MLKTKNALDIAIESRIKFENGQVDDDLLRRLYLGYNPLENIDTFILRSKELFPRLNCGLATLYLREMLGDGKVVRGKYNGVNHTFLLIDGDTVVDITPDQYGGPKVYVGPLKKPWGL